jgi:small-conductance mechanosensitive channel
MFRRLASAILVALAVSAAELVFGQGGTAPSTPSAELEVDPPTAPIRLDGRVLFNVRGISAYPAQERAAAIAARIAALAARVRQIHVVESEHSTDIWGDQHLIVRIFDADAALEGVDRHSLALAYAERVRAAIESYRQDRNPTALRLAAARAGIATVIFVASLWLLLRLERRLSALVERRYKERVPSVAFRSFQIFHAQRIWAMVRAAMRTLHTMAIVILIYLELQYVLMLFPWTRAMAQQLFGYLTDPLARIGRAILADVPDLIFLAILIIVVRYVLRIFRVFFDAVEHGTVTLSDFDPEWGSPTFRVVRICVLAFAIVVAYPYIPGSNSDAFKGVSIFVGLLLSIGSTSFVANIIAGYTLIYRRAFKAGDRIKVDAVIGDVICLRLQATFLRTLKNEQVIVPNSVILNSLIVNYSALARQPGLILHTTVGIGYETPWRQVEAMLLLAAQHTHGLLREPQPFVLQEALGDFAVSYELNAYCDDPRMMDDLYTGLHRHILDVFNEYGVQIMTPAYERDPESPKIVPTDTWFAAPAASADRATSDDR